MLQQHTHSNDEHEHGHGGDSEKLISHHDHDFNLEHHSIHSDQLHNLENAIKAMSAQQVKDLKEHSHSDHGGQFSYHSNGEDHHYKVVSHQGQLEVHKTHSH